MRLGCAAWLCGLGCAARPAPNMIRAGPRPTPSALHTESAADDVTFGAPATARRPVKARPTRRGNWAETDGSAWAGEAGQAGGQERRRKRMAAPGLGSRCGHGEDWQIVLPRVRETPEFAPEPEAMTHVSAADAEKFLNKLIRGFPTV